MEKNWLFSCFALTDEVPKLKECQNFGFIFRLGFCWNDYIVQPPKIQRYMNLGIGSPFKCIKYLKITQPLFNGLRGCIKTVLNVAIHPIKRGELTCHFSCQVI